MRWSNDVERSCQAIGVATKMGQVETGGAVGFDRGRQPSFEGKSRMNREVQVRISGGARGEIPRAYSAGAAAWARKKGQAPKTGADFATGIIGRGSLGNC